MSNLLWDLLAIGGTTAIALSMLGLNDMNPAGGGSTQAGAALLTRTPQTFTGVNNFSNATASTSTATGAVVITGGLGVGGNAFVGGTLNAAGIANLTSGTASTSTITGALVVTGGLGISGNAFVGGTLNSAGVASVTNATGSTSTSTGALVVTGGVGIGGSAFVGSNLNVAGVCGIGGHLPSAGMIGINGASGTNRLFSFMAAGTEVGFFGLQSDNHLYLYTSSTTSNINIYANSGTRLSVNGNTGDVTVLNNTASTNTTTGCLILNGGLGVAGAINGNGTLTVNGLITGSSTTLMKSNTTLTDYTGSASATMTNGPTAGNPTKWISVNDNGTIRKIPTWT